MILLNNCYELGTLLGTGGMGDVYRGTVVQTGETVAIKVLKAEIAAEAVSLDRFRQEGELLRDLNHPNIVKILEAFEHDGQHFIVMEYVSGGSLRDLLNDTPQLPIERVLWIALDLADALTRAHRLNVIHRDLKPENVLLAADGTPRLTDFGTAHLANISMNTQQGSLIGTPYYFSPELLQQQPLDARADIWAFGVLMFEMLAGQRPFAGDGLSQLLIAILREPVPDLEALRPEAPVALTDLVYRMLQKDRDARIPSVRLVGAELEALLREMATTRPLPLPSTAPISDDLILISVGHPQAAPEEMAGSRFATPANATDLRHNLPAQTTPFVGREDELADIARLIADPQTRLITVLGPGGMGKTRLTLEAAARYLGAAPIPEHHPRFEDGVFFVALAPLTDPGAIIPALAEAVGLQFSEGQNPDQQVLDFLREKSMLLIMDNFEHLLDGVAIVGEILKTALGVTVLASSRERLNLTGETLFTLGGMAFPDWETPADALRYAAVQLFMSSARHANHTFDLAPGDLPAVARICRLVAGMPLGIVLAAGWTDMLSVQEIASEIARSLDFLETEWRDVPDRHRSIRAVFESSWARLSESEREIFMQLAIFQGGFTREAAQAITGVSLRGLQALTNKSLVRRDPVTGRYEVHELLRQYAEQQLETAGHTAAACGAHSVYYTEFARQQGERIKGPQQFDAFKALAQDRQNLQEALRWAAQQGDTEAIGKSLFALTMLYWEWVDHNVIGEALITPLVATLAGQSGIITGTDRSRTAVYLQLRLMQHRLTPDQALKRTCAEESLRLLHDLDLWDEARFFVPPLLSYACMYGLVPWEEAVRRGYKVLARHRETNALFEFASNAGVLGEIARQMNRHEEAITLLEECLAISERLGDRWMVVFNMAVLGFMHHDRGRLEKARQLYESAYRRALDTGTVAHPEVPLTLLSLVTQTMGRFDEAVAYGTARLEWLVKQGNPLKIADAQVDLADPLILSGAFDRANALLAPAEVTLRQVNSANLGVLLLSRARIARSQGDLNAARQHLDAARAAYERFPSEYDPYYLHMEAGHVAFATGDMAGARQHFETVLTFITEELEKKELVGDGLICHIQLGRVALRQGNLARARCHLVTALKQTRRTGTLPITMAALLGIAEVFTAEGHSIRAVELAAHVQAQPVATYDTRCESENLLTQLAAELSPNDYDAAVTRAPSFDLDAMVQELLDERRGEASW